MVLTSSRHVPQDIKKQAFSKLACNAMKFGWRDKFIRLDAEVGIKTLLDTEVKLSSMCNLFQHVTTLRKYIEKRIPGNFASKLEASKILFALSVSNQDLLEMAVETSEGSGIFKTLTTT